MLGNNNCFREIGDRFNKSQCSSEEIFLRTCLLICKLSEEYIRWPTTNDEINATVEKFNNFRGSESFPNIVSSIDCKHIRIDASSKNTDSYLNRKCYSSQILQV